MGPGGNYISLLFLWTATEFVLELRLIFRNKSSNIFCIFEMLGYNFRIVAIIKKLNKSTEWIITKKSFGFWRDRRSTPTHGFIALYVVIFSMIPTHDEWLNSRITLIILSSHAWPRFLYKSYAAKKRAKWPQLSHNHVYWWKHLQKINLNCFILIPSLFCWSSVRINDLVNFST